MSGNFSYKEASHIHSLTRESEGDRSAPRKHRNGRRPGRIIAAAAAVSLVLGFGSGAGGYWLLRRASSSTGTGMVTAPGGMGGSGGANTMTYDYSGSYSGALTADGKAVTSSDATVSASDADQNVALAQNGGTLTISGDTLSKSGNGSNDDNCNFYGTNSILLAVGAKSSATVSDTKLTASGSGSNGIFVTDSATVNANSVTIVTQADNSRGLDATYGGTIIGNDVTIATKGDHSAAVATDRGGGSISLTGSKLSTAGSGSPLLYSTGDIEVSGVTGTASGSQIAGMEGYNTILIHDSTLTSTNTGTTGSDPIANGVIIYQSTSGDAESSTGKHATFQASGSTLSSAITSGAMFYITNTTADIVLSDTTLDFDSDAANLITAAGNDSNNWGSAGSNGATVTFTGRKQTLNGNVSADTISTLTLNLLDGSTWTGSASVEKNSSATTSTSKAPITVQIDGTSTWQVTADTTISALNVASGGKVVDTQGRTVTIVANGKTVVAGDSDVTVTVTGSYGTTVSADDTTQLSDDLIDRSDFDTAFGTSTSWSM